MHWKESVSRKGKDNMPEDPRIIGKGGSSLNIGGGSQLEAIIE